MGESNPVIFHSEEISQSREGPAFVLRRLSTNSLPCELYKEVGNFVSSTRRLIGIGKVDTILLMIA